MSTRIDAGREGYAHGAMTEVAIARTRASVASVGAELVRGAIPAQVSARVPGAPLFVTLPADGAGERPAPEKTVVCDLNAQAIAGTPGRDRSPATDAGLHASIYRDAAGVGGIVSVTGALAERVSSFGKSQTSAALAGDVQVVAGSTGAALAAATLEAAAKAVQRVVAMTGDDT